MKREMSVAGSFYPQRTVEIERYFEHFNQILDENEVKIEHESRAVIVPHAGYIYSGFTANIAYRILQRSGAKKILVIGPSHRVAFDGVSLCDFTSYDTPFGEIKSADDLYKNLKEKFDLNCFKDAHYEHSTEVQFPFLKYYMPELEIVELVYSKVDVYSISNIIDFVLSKEDCGVVISTDLSHFYNLNEAQKLDNICLDAVINLDIKKLHTGCEACGKIGIEAMIISAQKQSLHVEILDYRTSADASGDEARVVGYMSGYFR